MGLRNKYKILMPVVLLLIGCSSSNKLSISLDSNKLKLKNETNVNLKHFKDPLIFEIDVAQYTNDESDSIHNFMVVLTDSTNRKFLLCGIPNRPPYSDMQRLPVELKNNSILSFELPSPIYYSYCNTLKKPLYWQVLYVESAPIYENSDKSAEFRLLYESNKIQLSDSLSNQLGNSEHSGSRGSQILFSGNDIN